MRTAIPAIAAGLLGLAASTVPWPAAAEDGPIAQYTIAGDAIQAPLNGLTGDPESGRKLVLDRENGNCLICHKVPVPSEPNQGDIGPPLAGVGARLSPAQLRLRLVDESRLNPATLMPPYHRLDGLIRVAARYRGKPVFTAQEIEDVVTWLASLKK